MEAQFKMTKFHRDDSNMAQIRYKILPSRKIIAFGIAGTDLTILQFGENIDFDKKSDEILEKFQDSKNNTAFEYIPDAGFFEVDTNQQKWFIF